MAVKIAGSTEGFVVEPMVGVVVGVACIKNAFVVADLTACKGISQVDKLIVGSQLAHHRPIVVFKIAVL